MLHKLVAESRTDGAKLDPSVMPTEFAGFNFTGSLRPFQKTPRSEVPSSIVKPGWATSCELNSYTDLSYFISY
jgi:hypothetical protein